MMKFGELSLKQCRYGWMLFSGPFIGKCFELYGEYSESEVALMRNFVREGSTVIDVGANIGDLTIPLARMAGDSGRVYAFESHPDVFNVLCANLALNSIRNVRPINAFVATSSEVSTDSEVWGKFAFVSPTWDTQFMAIDALDLTRCDLIKVDVDGKELEVLQSGELTIERFRPILYFENDLEAVSSDLLGYCIEQLGYRLYWHLAPIFDPANFAGNTVNHWEPETIISKMVLGVPRERPQSITGLRPVTDRNDW